MKIGQTLGNVIFPNFGSKSAVAGESARADRDGGNGRDQYTRQQKKEEDDQSSSQESGPESGPNSGNDQKKKFEEALQSFKTDPQTQASGISAETEGRGPGLKVIVKDASGGVIRQYSGEEFMKLREAVSQDTKPRGRLLDQKF